MQGCRIDTGNASNDRGELSCMKPVRSLVGASPMCSLTVGCTCVKREKSFLTIMCITGGSANNSTTTIITTAQVKLNDSFWFFPAGSQKIINIIISSFSLLMSFSSDIAYLQLIVVSATHGESYVLSSVYNKGKTTETSILRQGRWFSLAYILGITAGNCKRTSKRKELKNTFPV